MARQCRGLDEQARWAKLADAAFVAAHAGLAMARNRGAGRELELGPYCYAKYSRTFASSARGL
jgi:hypothetical protein